MPEPKLPKKKKAFSKKDPDPCEGCSNCCEYVALEIDKPTTFDDFDQIYWYVIHKDVWVYADFDNEWHLQFNTPCDKLVKKRCGSYPQRPQICRDYEPVDCVRYNDDPAEKVLIKDDVDLFRYLAKKRPKIFEKMKKKRELPFTKKELLKKKVL